jgi:GNAT superfamily N-acetyltransferase
MGKRDWPLVVRRARPADRDAVMAFATHTWNDWDYVPHAWPRWLEDDEGVLLVGVVGGDGASAIDADGATLRDGQVVAIVRVAMPATTEAWLEGIRVDPRVRGMDVATDLQVAELHWAAANGARIVRYATSERNEGSHRLGARGGFNLLVELAGVSWEPPDYPDPGSGYDMDVQANARRTRRRVLDGVAPSFRPPPESVDELWRALSADAGFNAAARLYEPRPWALEELTESKFREHARLGEVLARGADSPGIAIVVADVAPAEETALKLSLLAGSAGFAWEIAEAVRLVAETPVSVRYAQGARVVEDVSDSYRGRGWEFSDRPLHILARPIDEANPPPEIDPRALVLEDLPQAVIKPPR